MFVRETIGSDAFEMNDAYQVVFFDSVFEFNAQISPVARKSRIAAARLWDGQEQLFYGSHL